MKTQYEVLFIFSQNETIFTSSLEKVKTIFNDSGVEIESEEDRGIRTLAYEVKKHKEGHYYLFNIAVDGLKIKTINDELRLHEDILRFLFVKKIYKKDRYAEKTATDS